MHLCYFFFKKNKCVVRSSISNSKIVLVWNTHEEVDDVPSPFVVTICAYTLVEHSNPNHFFFKKATGGQGFQTN